MLSVTVKTKPITLFFRVIRILFFYVNGSHFRISSYVKNFDSPTFQGGKLTVYVKYAFGQLYEEIEGKVGAIKQGEKVRVDFEGANKWGVVANGHALFLANLVDNNGNLVALCDEDKKSLQKQEFTVGKRDLVGYHVHTFHALSLAEFFSLTALFVNSLAFIANVILITYVNQEKLSDAWSFLQINSALIVPFAFVIVVLWIVFVYFLYDRYGL
jgi:hypothetical protein